MEDTELPKDVLGQLSEEMWRVQNEGEIQAQIANEI